MSEPLARAPAAARAARALVTARRPVLFLDVDGTLAPIVSHPWDAVVPLPTRRTLTRLRLTGAVVVLVSGRSARDALAVAGTEVDAVFGNHGADLLRDGRLRVWSDRPAPSIDRAVRRLETVVTDWKGIRLERKERSIALHHRLHGEASANLLRRARRRLRGSGFIAHAGRNALDIRWKAAHKGVAVLRWLEMVEAGMVTRDQVLYAGDDTTDAAAIRALGRSAVTIEVGPRQLGARFRTTSPATLARWLARLAWARMKGRAARERTP